MGDREQWTAQNVVEAQIEAYATLDDVLKHSTIRSNPTLRTKVAHALEQIKTANIGACMLWFLGDLKKQLLGQILGR